jgi:beta-lactamase superfamily II metal-dependent hydrolase
VIQYVEEDFVALRRHRDGDEKPFLTLAFGDAVEVLEEGGDWTHVRALTHFDGIATGFVRGRPPLRDRGVLKMSMVDVQQGDGLVLETPEGKIVLVDGGDNQLFARHLAARFKHRGSSAEAPLEVDAILVTHGDADHFDGLNDVRRSESLPRHKAHKRLFLHPRRVFHNGLVKAPSALPDAEIFGATVERDGETLIVDLYDDPRDAPPARRNQPFGWWCESLDHWERHGPIAFHRVAFGMDETELFDFLHEEGVGVEIQGPFATEVEAGGARRPALPFFHKPRKSAEIHLERPGEPSGGLSASHTINGHSVALRLTFGNVRFNLTGDLNQESMALMRRNLPLDRLEAEVVKAPHHGSHDFDLEALRAMRPVVAIVSSGDESVMKEHIHPRATLMAALGKVMRGDTGVLFCTELAAFFATQDECYTRDDLKRFFAADEERTYTGKELRDLFTGVPRDEDPAGRFFGFERLNFGIIHIRTDGERVLAFTHSGKQGTNEAYSFRVTMEDGERKIDFADEVSTR